MMRARNLTVLTLGLFPLAFVLRAQEAPPASAPAAPEKRRLGDPKPFPFPFEHPRTPVEELRGRRAALAQAIGDGAVVLVSSEPPALSSGARYKPDHDVFYYTGVETDFCGFMMVCRDGVAKEVKLFVPKFDRNYELWNGARVVAGDDAKALTSIEEVVAVKSGGIGGDSLRPFEEALRALAEDPPGPVYLGGGRGRSAREGLDLTPLRRADRVREFLLSVREDLQIRTLSGPSSRLRGVKSPWEISLIREAVRISGEGFVRALRQVRPGMWEFEFQALMEQAFIEFGCTGLPYYPIAGSGPNACVLHYTDNRRQFQDGDLVLCDIAAEYGWYAADITRTFPCNGRFTPRQRQVYEAVLAGQTAAAAALRPGATMEILDKACRAAMRSAGLKESELHPHGLGHHVGLDVHDPGGAEFRAGMITTIEPGSYLKKEGFGVRIEDCYLVTENGCECLSADIPRTVEAIEAIVGAAYREPK